MKQLLRVPASLLLSTCILLGTLHFSEPARAEEGPPPLSVGDSQSRTSDTSSDAPSDSSSTSSTSSDAPSNSSSTSSDVSTDEETPPPGVLTVKRISPNTLTQQVFDQVLLLQSPPLTPYLPDTVDAELMDGATVTIAGVSWTADKRPFDPSIPGDYVFTPELPAGYAFSADPNDKADIIPIEVHIVEPASPPDVNVSDPEEPEDSPSSDVEPSSSAAETPSENFSAADESVSSSAPEIRDEDIPPQTASSSSVWENDLPASHTQGAEKTLPPEQTTVLVTVIQEDIREGQLLPWPRVKINGSYNYPAGTITRLYTDHATIGSSSYTEDHLPSAPGRYTVTVTYDTPTRHGVGSTDFSIIPRGGPLPPDQADVIVGPLYSSYSRRNLLERIEDINGFRSVSSRRVDYMDISPRVPGEDLRGRIVTIEYPPGTNRRTHDFVLVHEYAPGRVERVSISEDRYGISFRVDTLSPFALAWRYTSTDPWEDRDDRKPDRDNDRYSSFKEGEYDFWMSVRRKVENARGGDLVIVRARGYDKMPEVVMRALRDNDGVSMKIIWNGGSDIIIPAGEAQTPDGLRIFWPLSRLEDLYDGASLTVDKENLPDEAPFEEETPPPPPPGSAASGSSGKPYPSTGGIWRADAPETPASVTPAQTPDRLGVAESVEKAEQARSNPSVLLSVSDLMADSDAQSRNRLPDSLILILVLLTICSLFGIFTAVWLFSKKPKTNY